MMGRLIKAEFMKLYKSFGLKILLLCAVSSGILVGLMFAFIFEGGFGEATGLTFFINGITGETEVASAFAGVFVAIFVGSEFVRGTFGISIARGCSRNQLILAKAVVFLVALPFVLLASPITSTISATLANGFGDFDTLHLLRTIGLLVLTHWAMGGICILLAVSIKNVGGIIGASVAILAFLIPILARLPGLESMARFLYPYHIARITEPQSIAFLVAVCIATLGISLTGAVMVFKRAELK